MVYKSNGIRCYLNFFRFEVNCAICLFLLLSAGLKPAYGQKNKIDSLTNLIDQHPADDERKAKLLYELSSRYVYADPKKGLVYLDQIISFQNKIKADPIVASAYRLKGVLLYLLTKFPEALVSLNEAFAIDQANKHAAGIAGDYANIGMVYLAQSNFAQALTKYTQAANIYDSLPGLQNETTAIYANIGVIYLQMNNFVKATEHFQKVIKISKKLHNVSAEALASGNMAVIALKQKNYSNAISYGQTALKLSDSTGNQAGVARETGNLAGYYIASGQYDKGMQFGLKAIELNKALNNVKSIGFNNGNIADAYLKKANYEQAKIYSLAQLKIGNDLKLIEIQLDASEGLSQIYAKTHMPDSALYYYKQYGTLKDSIYNDDKRQEITRMGIQYDFDKKELTYKQQQELSEEKLKQQRLQLALNNEQLQRNIQQRDLQEVQLQNEKLRTRAKQKQLIIAVNNEKLQAAKVKSLSQEQMLDKLRMNQFWLYGILLIVVLTSVLLYWLNLYRIRQLRLKNTLQQQEAEQRALEIGYQNKLSESELKAIRSQMNPHFIFNVLNSIESYVLENDSKTASRLVQKFASLSRLILENSTQSMVTADREWKTLKLYTELEAMRYSNQFTYSFYVDPELDLATLMLPPMLVQPLIENSIHHGLRNSTTKNSSVNVRLEQTTTEVYFTVDDNGIGFDEAANFKNFTAIKSKSIGLAAIRERIEIINGINNNKAATFNIHKKKDNEGPGTIAILTLPKVFK